MKNENVTKYKVPFKDTNGKTYLVDANDPRVNNIIPLSNDVSKTMTKVKCPVCEKLVGKNYIKRHIMKYHPDYDIN